MQSANDYYLIRFIRLTYTNLRGSSQSGRLLQNCKMMVRFYITTQRLLHTFCDRNQADTNYLLFLDIDAVYFTGSILDEPALLPRRIYR